MMEIEAARTTTSSLAKEKEPPVFKQGLGFSSSSENAPLKARFCLPGRHLFSPPERERSTEKYRSKEGGRDRDTDTDTDREVELGRERNGGVVYSMLIEGYDNLYDKKLYLCVNGHQLKESRSRVKAKMKLQLAETGISFMELCKRI